MNDTTNPVILREHEQLKGFTHPCLPEENHSSDEGSHPLSLCELTLAMNIKLFIENLVYVNQIIDLMVLLFYNFSKGYIFGGIDAKKASSSYRRRNSGCRV